MMDIGCISLAIVGYSSSKKTPESSLWPITIDYDLDDRKPNLDLKLPPAELVYARLAALTEPV
jgi:hypothetical protein